MNRASRLEVVLAVLLTLIGIYITIAEAVFALRHPWVTKTEQFLHFFDAMAFRKVPYSEFRPRE